MEIKQLPPQKSPKQITASHRPQTLQEHFLSFLNYNNQNGFQDDNDTLEIVEPAAILSKNNFLSLESIKEISIETIGSLMFMLATRDEITLMEFKIHARKITDLSRKKIGYCRSIQLISRLLGYSSEAAMYAHLYRKHNIVSKKIRNLKKAKRDNLTITNRRDKSMLQMKFLDQSQNNN